MERGKLYGLVGLPRSGKSTVANEWVKGDKVRNPNGHGFFPYCYVIDRPRVIVGGDDFRVALYGQEYNLNGEASVFAAMDVAVRALLARGFDVIIDETCTTEDTLSRYLRLDLDFTPIFIDTPEEVCVERAIATNKPFLVAPIRNMARQLADLRPRWDETRARLTKRLRDRYPHSFPAQTPEAA